MFDDIPNYANKMKNYLFSCSLHFIVN